MIESEVENALRSLYALQPRPDAIFTSSDRITTGCLATLKKMNLAYNDIGFAGFTNSNLAELFSPALTVVRQPAFETGQLATELLIQVIESKRPVTSFETRLLETELIIRASSNYKHIIEERNKSKGTDYK
jgi:LacI family transcriptional regulator